MWAPSRDGKVMLRSIPNTPRFILLLLSGIYSYLFVSTDRPHHRLFYQLVFELLFQHHTCIFMVICFHLSISLQRHIPETHASFTLHLTGSFTGVLRSRGVWRGVGEDPVLHEVVQMQWKCFYWSRIIGDKRRRTCKPQPAIMHRLSLRGILSAKLKFSIKHLSTDLGQIRTRPTSLRTTNATKQKTE